MAAPARWRPAARPSAGGGGRAALAPAREVVRIVAAHYGDEAGMMGAALLAFDHLDAAP